MCQWSPLAGACLRRETWRGGCQMEDRSQYRLSLTDLSSCSLLPPCPVLPPPHLHHYCLSLWICRDMLIFCEHWFLWEEHSQNGHLQSAVCLSAAIHVSWILSILSSFSYLSAYLSLYFTFNSSSSFLSQVNSSTITGKCLTQGFMWNPWVKSLLSHNFSPSLLYSLFSGGCVSCVFFILWAQGTTLVIISIVIAITLCFAKKKYKNILNKNNKYI